MSMNWDATGKVVNELIDDAAVAAIVGANPSTNPRVRGGEPAPGDAQGSSSFRAFVVVVPEGWQRLNRVPVARQRLVARCYGRTRIEASQLATAVSNAQHYAGARAHANGLGVYASWDDGGGESDLDPDTKQPMVPVFLDWITTTVPVS